MLANAAAVAAVAAAAAAVAVAAVVVAVVFRSNEVTLSGFLNRFRMGCWSLKRTHA